MQHYSGVVLAYGASKEKEMNIPGEQHLTSATDIINWYNGEIDYFHKFLSQINFKFENLKDISVIGNGNVATDLARVFLKSIEEFAGSDMPDSVMDIIKKPSINSVSMIARRGIFQSAFTTKEIRELSKVDKLQMYLWKQDIDESHNEASLREAELGSSENARAIARRTKFLLDNCQVIENEDQFEEIKSDPSHKKLFLRYFLSPESVESKNNMTFARTMLVGDPNFQRCIIKETESENNHMKITSDLILKSIGYRSIPLDDVPFNYYTHTIPNEKGWVINDNGDIVKGLYVWGWAKRGPFGIIDSTLKDSYETFRMIKYHLENNLLDPKQDSAERLFAKVKK